MSPKKNCILGFIYSYLNSNRNQLRFSDDKLWLVVVVGVQVKHHNSSCSKMSRAERAELERWSRACQLNIESSKNFKLEVCSEDTNFLYPIYFCFVRKRLIKSKFL